MLKILIGSDGSPAALQAVHHALALAQAGLKASYVLANVQTPTTLYEMVVAHDAELSRRAAQEAGEHLLAPAQALLRDAGVEHEAVVALGDAANTLLELAQTHGCQAIMVGAHGHSQISGVLMGSVSQQLVQRSPWPVTVVKSPTST